ALVGGTGPDEEQVDAQTLDALGHGLLRALPDSHESDHSADADDDAQHGERGPHLVGDQRLERHLHRVLQAHGRLHSLPASPPPAAPAPWVASWGATKLPCRRRSSSSALRGSSFVMSEMMRPSRTWTMRLAC